MENKPLSISSVEHWTGYSAITEKCKRLPKEQFDILSDIINKFIEAINIERQQKKQ